jgi:hypothetical protein
MRKGIRLGILAAIVIIVGAGAFYLASPLFISTEIDEPLPNGAELPSSTSEQFREFMAMSEKERIEAGNQMSEQEKTQIMLDFSKINNSIDESMTEINQSSENDISDMLLSGSFIGVEDGIHDAQGDARVIPIENGDNVLRLENLIVTNGPIYMYISQQTKMHQTL